MAFQKQIGARARITGLGRIVGNQLLSFTISDSIIFALLSMKDANEDVRAVGGHCSNGCESSEQQNAVGARISDIGKFLQLLAHFCDRSAQRCDQVSTKLVLDSGGDFLQSHRPQFRHHSARTQGFGEIGRACTQQVIDFDTDVSVQGLPSAVAGSVTRGIATMPPDKKEIRVRRPGRLLRSIVGLEPNKNVPHRSANLRHNCGIL